MNLKKITMMLSVIGASAIMLGCGSSSSTEIPGWKGKLVDTSIEGVDWSCEGASGTTKADGVFGACPKGSVVTFSLGSVTLGSVGEISDHIITPQDLVGVKKTDTNNPKVIALAVLFQSLDSDGNASNGIKIERPAILGLEEAVKENNVAGTVASLEPSVIIANVKEAVVKANETGKVTLNTVSTDDAKKHLDIVLGQIKSGAISAPIQPGETTGAEGGNG